jgi:hypothetical protein
MSCKLPSNSNSKLVQQRRFWSSRSQQQQENSRYSAASKNGGTPHHSAVFKQRSVTQLSCHDAYGIAQQQRKEKKRQPNQLQRTRPKQATFFESTALHYLCHHYDLEDSDMADFYAQYEQDITLNSNNRDTWDFQDTPLFDHPAALEKNGKHKKNSSKQELAMQTNPFLLRVHQKLFPDTASFGGSSLDSSTNITQK